MIRANLEVIVDGFLQGWFFNSGDLNSKTVHIVADGAYIGATVAERFRQDLLDASVGSGAHGFELRLPAEFSTLR